MKQTLPERSGRCGEEDAQESTPRLHLVRRAGHDGEPARPHAPPPWAARAHAGLEQRAAPTSRREYRPRCSSRGACRRRTPVARRHPPARRRRPAPGAGDRGLPHRVGPGGRARRRGSRSAARLRARGLIARGQGWRRRRDHRRCPRNCGSADVSGRRHRGHRRRSGPQQRRRPRLAAGVDAVDAPSQTPAAEPVRGTVDPAVVMAQRGQEEADAAAKAEWDAAAVAEVAVAAEGAGALSRSGTLAAPPRTTQTSRRSRAPC